MKTIDQFQMHQRVVVVDLDGTLCNSAHREHLASAKLWDEFHSLMRDDLAHQDVAEMVRMLDGNNVYVYALTGRPEKYREQTMDWLLQNDIPVDHLSMRPNHDWSSDAVVKPKMLEEALDGANLTKDNVWFILDDREKVVEAWRNAGYNCWQPRVGGY